MKLNSRWEPRNSEQRLQEMRNERVDETRRIEGLSAIPAKKASSAKAA
jgi:hypothetical protein